MSQENVEVVRRAIAEWNEGDDAASALSEEVVTKPPDGWPEGDDLRIGRQAWREESARLRESWKEVRVELDEARAVDDERVLAFFRYVATGRESGLSFDTPLVMVATVREGKVVQQLFFNTREEALEAAGLSE